MLVPRQSPYRHHLWWLCCLRGVSLRPINSWCSYKILLALWDVIIIIHINEVSIRIIHIRRRMPTPQVSLRIWQEIDRWKCPPIDTLKRLQYNWRSSWPPISKWISRTHLAYYNPNGARIYHRKASWPKILVLLCTTCSNDAESSPWQTRHQTNNTIWASKQLQTRLQDMVWAILYRIFQPWYIYQRELFQNTSTHTRLHSRRSGW